MPYIGRYTSYPQFPEFGGDPTQFLNALSIVYQVDNLGPGATHDFQLKTADKDVRIYDQSLFFLESEVDYIVLEGATCTDGVTVVPVENADRNSVFVTSLLAFDDPTGISGGIDFDGMEQFALNSGIIGAANRNPLNVQYITLKLNSNYIFRFINQGTETITKLRLVLLLAE